MFVTSTTRVSPAFALIVGPGYWPLMPITRESTQSGAQEIYSTSHFRCLALAAKVDGRKNTKQKQRMKEERLGDMADDQ